MTDSLLEQSVAKSLLRAMLPVTLSLLMTLLFQLVDSLFIARLGTAELAAISFFYPLYMLLLGLLSGVANTITAAVAKSLGAGKWLRAKRQFSLLVVSLVLGWWLFCMGLYHLQSLLFAALGADTEMVGLIRQYSDTLLAGFWLLALALFLNAALMAKGLSGQTSIVWGVSGLVNLLADYLLIFGFGPFPALGMQGAALATLLAWAVAAAILAVLVVKQDLFNWRAVRFDGYGRALLSPVLMMSMPAAAAQAITPIATALLVRLVSQFGELAMAAYGIVVRIESVGLAFVFALGIVSTPMVAQYYGAALYQRIGVILAYALRIILFGCVLLGLMLWLVFDDVVRLFSQDMDVIAIAASFLLWVVPSYLCFAWFLLANAYFTGVQKPAIALWLTMARAMGVMLPLAWLGAQYQINYIWSAIAAANTLLGVCAYRAMQSHSRSLAKSEFVHARAI